MQATWVVVADHDFAAIYTVRRGMARLRRHRQLQPPSAAAASVADGRDGASSGADGSGLPGTADERARSFAAHVALHVEDGYLARQFDELILAAAPDFLVHLRASLSETVRAAVVAEITRNLVGARLDLLQELILRVL